MGKTIKISSIKKNPDNPRLIKDSKFMELVESLKTFPKMMSLRPIIVDEEMIVQGGNMRLKALTEIGYKEIPAEWVKEATDFTEEELREFIIKDNVSFGEWDLKMLKDEWDIKKLEQWGLDDLEFEIDEPEASEDNYEVPDGGVETDIKLGDIFQIGNHKLLCGSSTEESEWKKLFQDQKADMILTDPPYNVDYEGGTGLKIMNDKMENNAFYKFLFDAFSAAFTITKEGGAWYVWHADSEGVNFRNAFEDSGLLMKQCLIWVKNALVMGRQDYQWKHEPCLYGWKPGDSHYFINERFHTTTIDEPIDINKLKKSELLALIKEANETSIIRCDKPRKSDMHPTMKPILVLTPFIKNSSRQGEIIADGFAGSGSTMVAAHQMKRRCYAIELDPKYCQVIVDRMMTLDVTLEVKLNGENYIKK